VGKGKRANPVAIKEVCLQRCGNHCGNNPTGKKGKRSRRQVVSGRCREVGVRSKAEGARGTYPSDPDLTYPQKRSTQTQAGKPDDFRPPISDRRPEGPPPPAGSLLGCC